MIKKLPELLIIPKSVFSEGQIRIPGSKSITNRAIMVAALAKGRSILRGALSSDDTFYMMETWKKLGVSIKDSKGVIEIDGCNGQFSSYDQELYIENAGTAARFLTACLTIGKGSYHLTGNSRMQTSMNVSSGPTTPKHLKQRSRNARRNMLRGTSSPPITSGYATP